MFSEGFVIGIFAIGIAIGLCVGLAVGKKQKPWSELSAGEKKLRIWLIAAGIILLVAGIIVNLRFSL